jgi:cytochrome c oxidase subunit 2
MLPPDIGPIEIPSALIPAGPAAREIAALWWAMLVAGAVILLAVCAILLWHALPGGRRPRRLAGRRLVVLGGIAFPTVALSALLLWSLGVGGRLVAALPADALRIEVVGRMWWWEVRYLAADGTVEFVGANELRIPTGRPVELLLESADVIHSFWVPRLAGKTDMIPGRTNRLTIEAEEAAIYRGQCAELCGLQHARMALYVESMAPDEFEAWHAGHMQPAPAPATPFLARGRDLFVSSGCGACHRVRGLDQAEGTLGPDLTFVGQRISLAAGLLPNGVGALAGWIASAQHLKPGNAMPSFAELEGEDLRALAAWLESLQ